ncbi:unnamed protein product [Hymenolepis diminuta]|nr:unnamed protein product [Hymenolepis diminuta]
MSRVRRRRDHLAISRERFNGLKCPEPRPVDNTECQLGPCQENRPFWWPVVSTACIANGCNRGYQERELQCLTPSFVQVDPKECAYSRKPRDKIPCTKRECKTYRWRADSWTRCPYACGKHSRYRNVRCVDDLGGEYADHLCQAHLRPDSWSLCPDACPDYPISCWDQKQRDPSSTDGVYDMTVHRQVVKIYCSDMETTYPKEYLPLYHRNYASIRHITEISDQNCSSSPTEPLYYNGKVTDIDETADATVQSHQLSDHASDSVTVFKKIRINLNTLHVDIFDGRFADEWGLFVPYAIAKSCSRGTCQLGKFLINLEDTGFAVSKETQWRASREKSFGQVIRRGNSKIIIGTCGGDCGGCWPDPFLILEVIDLESR